MSEKRLDTVRLQRLARAYCESAVFFAALDLSLFTRIAEGHDSDAELADAVGVTPLDLERVVTVCQAMGLVRREDGRLCNAPDVERFLVEGKPGYAGAWMQFTRPEVEPWFGLAERLGEKRTPTRLGRYADLTVDGARKYHRATASIGFGAGRRFVRHVDLSTRRKLLDLGGGSGAYSISAVKAFPELRAVVLDLPPVVEVTKEFIAEHGVGDRVETLGADFTRDAFPDDVDVVVMASNLPIYDEPVIREVVRKAYDALLPGGEMHLVGEMLNDDRSGPLDAALWGLENVFEGCGGKAHTIGECRGYFEEAGFQQVTDQPFIPAVLQRVSGLKPARARGASLEP